MTLGQRCSSSALSRQVPLRRVDERALRRHGARLAVAHWIVLRPGLWRARGGERTWRDACGDARPRRDADTRGACSHATIRACRLSVSSGHRLVQWIPRARGVDAPSAPSSRLSGQCGTAKP